MQKQYPLSKEEMSLYLACTLNPQRKQAYLVNWSVEFSKNTDKARIENAVSKLFDRHRILSAKITRDAQGNLCKYDSEESPVIEYETSQTDFPPIEHYYGNINLDGGRLYRIVIVDSPNSVTLIVIAHHIVLDGNSRQVMVRDFETAYRGEDLGKPDFAPYEFAEKELAQEKSESFAEDKQYFQNLLSDIECPSPENDIHEKAESFGQCFYDLNSINTSDIQNKKISSGVRTSTIFLGAVGHVAALFSGTEQTVIASAMSGRTDEIKNSCGMFVRTLPMVCNTDPNRTVNEYLQELDKQTTENRKHSLYTYMDMNQELGISLPITFAYQGDMVGDKILFDGEEHRMSYVLSKESDYQMQLYIWRKNGRHILEVAYRSDLFSKSFIDSLAQTIEQILCELLCKNKMSEIELLSPVQKQLLDSFNKTEQDYEKTDIVTQFKRQAAAHPDNIAVVFKDKKLTYREVDELTEKIAAYIASKGIGREDVVSVLIPRSEYMVIASLGVVKSGAAYEPLDPSYPSERLEFMIADAEAKLLIADRTLMQNVPNYKGDVLYIDEISEVHFDKLSVPQTIKPELHDRFIMLYTSGTTGTPKGVMLEHGNLAAFCGWYRRFYSLTEQSRVAAYASYGFDANMMDLYPALTTGAAVVIIPEEDRLDFAAIKKSFDDNGVTHSFMTTQVGRQFAEFCDGGSLKYLSTGGEKLAPIFIEKPFKFYNVYGPTECTIFSSTFEVDKLYERVPIGKPLDNMKFYICDKLLRRLPAFAPGELVITGVQVGRGYLNRPEKNAEVFIKNPFEKIEGYEKAYRTGDVVRILGDGNVDCIGRNDGQVKIRGFRIELPEVEAVIREYKGIKDVTVQAFDDPNGGKFIAAYIVSDEKIDVTKLNDFIGSKKPPYMIPACTMQIDSIPLNQNQKVNKRALPEPVLTVTSDENEDVRELNSLEEKIIEAVKEIVGDVPVGVSRKLTDYGLTSISSIRLIPILASRFHADISAAKLVAGMSVLDIENEIMQQWSDIVLNGTAQTTERTQSQKLTFAKLSSVQLAVYYDSIRKNKDCLYNIPLCYDFNNTDEKQLKSAAEKAIEAHPCLSTHLKMQKGEILQVYNDSVAPEVALSEMDETAFTSYKDNFVRPFDLTHGPLYRAEVVKTEKAVYFLFDAHHLVYDGFSSSILIGDICAGLRGEEVKPEEYTSLDYAADEEKAKETSTFEEAKSYYQNMFTHYEEPTMIPTDLAGKEDDGLLGEVTQLFGKKETDEFCAAHGITAAALFLAATFLTSSRYAGNKNIALSMLSSGRSSVKTTRTVGMFVHTVPLVIDLARQLSANELVSQSSTIMRQSIQHEIYPFAEIASAYGYRTEIMYEYQVGITGEEQNYEIIPLVLESPKFKMAVVIGESDGNYTVTARYNDALYSKEYAQTFAASLCNVTRSLITQPESDIKTIGLMNEEETKKVLALGSVRKCEIPHKLLHKAFEAAVTEYSGKETLVTYEGSWSFAKLNERANTIAKHLLEKNVQVQDSIVLLLPRRLYYFAALFGVVKTGAVFIPCDPEYPAERISHIVGDAGAKYIITTADHASEYSSDSVLLIDDLLSGTTEQNISADISPESLVYMIYTSGSTGKPKGVELTHLGICNYIHADPASPLFDFMAKNKTRMVSVTTVSFDMSMKDTIGVICNGGTVIFANEDEMNDPRALAKMFTTYKADGFNATPSRLLQYMEYEPFQEMLSQCKIVACGGEGYPLTLLEKLKKLGIPNIINTYGPTEITVSSNMAVLTNADHISIGKPLPNYTEYIVDSDGNLVPQGVIGELLIGGLGVARGYHNLPEMTAQKFVTFRGERIYKSGDYAKWDKDGNVLILGRKDNQVKLRGLRIELTEISELIEAQEGIKKAIVLIRKLAGQDNLCAYFTADRTIDINSLRDELSKKLTKYMVPTAYLQLESIPVTPNGKTDIKNLPEPQAVSTGEYVEPVGEIEKTFADIFARILKLEKVGATDNFFEIGGTSLIAASVVIQADQSGYEITFGDLFAHKTPRAIAKFLSGESDEETETNAAANYTKYNHTAINEVLAKNTLDSFLHGEKQPIGNILLTGSTGYMGMHVLFTFLQNEEGTAYCLVRAKKGKDTAQRLDKLFLYYFGDIISSLPQGTFQKFRERIKVVEGDVTDIESLERIKDLPINTVFNCAANVKHFSSGTDIEDVNVGGVINCIRFCKASGARLIHFSTTSVAGTIKNTPENSKIILTEQNMFYGQELANQYTSSKMLAELEVMKAIIEDGLNAKIIRVGTLAARDRDGEFQANYLSNSFAGRLRSYFVLKAFPYSMMDSFVRMGPIDVSSEAFLKLARTPKENCLFNAVNNNTLPLSILINVMRECGIQIDYVEDDEFTRRFEEAEKEPEKAQILQSITAYKSLHKAGLRDVAPSGDFTAQLLARMNFFWPVTSTTYIERFVNGLIGLDFFDEDFLNR